MSNIDKQAREELRKRYTPPEIPKCSICGAELSIQRCGGSEPTVYACDGYEADPENPGMVRLAAGRDIADKHYEESRYIDWIKGGDSDVVALLDELEAADALNKHLELAIRKAEGCSEALRRKTEAAENRVAELEAREVREEGNQFIVVRHPGKSPVIKHSVGDLEVFLRQLLEHDPMATIDIITHRYYGVGGQWVQDADEYLHMMDSAGIRINGED